MVSGDVPLEITDSFTLRPQTDTGGNANLSQGEIQAMAYVTGNPKTKKELRERIAAGRRVEVFSPGPFGCKQDGEETIEGPHYPEPHRWYARVKVEGGVIVKVIS